MASTSKSEVRIPLADFTNAGGGTAANAAIFKQELALLALSVQPDRVQINDGAMQLNFDAQAHDPSDDDPIIAGAVTAHVGGAVVGGAQRVISEAESSNDTTTNAEKAALASGLLEAGSYTLSWYCEIATTSVLALSGAKAVLEVDLGGGFIERGEISHDLNTYMPFSGSLPQDRVDGQKIDARIRWRRLGALSNPARIQRCRIAITREA